MASRFGDCTFDPETRELFRGEQRVAITPKAFQLLRALLEKRPKAVSKEELHEILWPKTFVSEGSLARLVNEVRHAVGDNAEEPRFVRTVHGFGYAFSGPLAEERGAVSRSVSPDHVLKLIWGGREIALQDGENLLGRAEDCVASIDVHSVSRHHARIVVSGKAATLEDLGSKNGTFVADRRLEGPRQLADGDTVRIGTVTMTFRRFSRNASTQTIQDG
jgi:DNA-binding winged helix-turn-helix (wHTH) protein